MSWLWRQLQNSEHSELANLANRDAASLPLSVVQLPACAVLVLWPSNRALSESEIGMSPKSVGTSIAAEQATIIGNSIVTLPVISATSATPVSGARTIPVKSTAIPTTANSTGCIAMPGRARAQSFPNQGRTRRQEPRAVLISLPAFGRCWMDREPMCRANSVYIFSAAADAFLPAILRKVQAKSRAEQEIELKTGL